MKKLFLTVLSILACGAAQALPVGNPSEASLLCDGLFWEGSCCLDMCDPCTSWCDAISFRLGYYGDFVFNRHLKIDDCGPRGHIRDTEIFTNAAYLVANGWDRADLFLTLGATNFLLHANAKEFGGEDGSCFEIKTNTDFSWSVGGHATIWECGCTTLGAEAQYFYTRPDIDRIVEGCMTTIQPAGCIDLKYMEWQIGVGVSHRICLLVPYIAIKWSHAKIDFGDADFGTIFLPDAKSEHDFGYAIGVSLVDCEKAAVTAEVRFLDEKALYINGQFRF